MAALVREAFADEGSWLQYQANLVWLLRKGVVARNQPKKRKKLTPHQLRLNKKQQYAAWYVLRGGKQWKREYKRVKRATDPVWRACNHAYSITWARKKRGTDPEWRALQNALNADRERVKYATDPEWRERKLARNRAQWANMTQEQRATYNAKKRARDATKRAAKRQQREGIAS